MKKKIFFTYVVLCFGLQMNAQTEFAPIGTEWYYTYTFGCCPENHFNHIISEKDTIIEGSSCRVLKQYYDGSDTVSEKYIVHQEQGKIYYYYQNQFNLLLDFDVEINDTIVFTFMYKEYNDNFPLGKDTVFSARFQVESITSDVQNLKTITTKIVNEDIHELYGISVPPNEYNTYSYTEKIGLYREFMPVFDNLPHPAEDVFRWLRCYSDADFSFISEEWASTSLPYNNSAASILTNPKDDRGIKIYFDPITNNISILTDYRGHVDIINISGKVVCCSELSTGMNEISINYLHNGVFFIKVQTENNRIKTFKMIKS